MDIDKIMKFSEIFIECLIPVISLYTSRKLSSTYVLHKDYKPKDISKVNLPVELRQKYTDVDVSHIASSKVKKVVLEFTTLLIEKFPPELLSNFYNNINEINIKKNHGVLLIAADGMYSCKKNKINYSAINSIYHELFHMASSVYNERKRLCYSGFSQVYYSPINRYVGNNIGFGINEGYTELMAYRYFERERGIPITYEFEVGVVEHLEKIIDQKEMEKLYLTANLMGLINDLKEYASLDDILDFITRVDLVNNHYIDNFIFPNNKMQESIISIYRFLLKTYIVKLEKQLDKEIITKEEFLDKIKRYIKALGTSVKIGRHIYEYFTRENLFAILKEINIDNEEIVNLCRK